MKASLLTVPDVGDGLTQTPATPPTKDKLPCGGTSADQLYPNALRVELNAAKEPGPQYQEGLTLFLDAATATKAFDTTVSGMDCTKGSIGGTAVTIGKAQDVTTSVGGSRAMAWEITIHGLSGIMIMAEVNSVVVESNLAFPTGIDTSTVPDPISVAKKAVAKVIAAGLG